MTATRRPWLGLDLGGGAPVSAHGALGYAVVTSRDLREAMLTLARYGATRNDAMAWRLSISTLTVRSHVKNIMSKLDADTRTEAVATALRRDLID